MFRWYNNSYCEKRVVEEKNNNEKQQNSNLDSKGVAETKAVPTIVPPPQPVVSPQEVSAQPSTQIGQNNPPQPPQQAPPRGAQAPDLPDFSEETLQISRDTLRATKSMVRATYWGIFVAALAAAVFLA